MTIFSLTRPAVASTATFKDDTLSSVVGVSDSQAAVGLHLLTDSEREAAIHRAGKLVEKYMAVWERDGCFAARGKADHAALLMKQLIAGRSPTQVAWMEKERGLR